MRISRNEFNCKYYFMLHKFELSWPIELHHLPIIVLLTRNFIVASYFRLIAHSMYLTDFRAPLNSMKVIDLLTHMWMWLNAQKSDLHTNGLHSNKLRICNDQKCAAVIIICILILWLLKNYDKSNNNKYNESSSQWIRFACRLMFHFQNDDFAIRT